MKCLNNGEYNRRSSAGFSLLEVLVATTILIVIVLMVTNMFRNASEAWDIGGQSAEMNTAGRAAIAYMARELACAVAGSMPDSAGATKTIKEFVLAGGNEISATVMLTSTQKLCGVRFRFDSTDHTIKTDHYTTDTDNNFRPYEAGWGSVGQAQSMLIPNVWNFAVGAYSDESDLIAGNSSPTYDSSANGNMLPACVDLTIEMLSERDMARALSPGLPDQAGFVMTNSRVYTTRVYFPNRGAR